MKKYAVALYSNFDGSMKMDIVLASSQVDACKQMLISDSEDYAEFMNGYKTYEAIQQYAFGIDHAIGAIEVNESKRFSTNPPRAYKQYDQDSRDYN